jgi:hypothetical protein
MKNQKSMILGVMAFLPMFYIILSWLLILPNMFKPIKDSTTMERRMSQVAGLHFVMDIIFLIAIILVILTFVLNVRNNRSIQEKTKISWTVLIIIGSAITIPIYWYKYIVRSNRIER